MQKIIMVECIVRPQEINIEFNTDVCINLLAMFIDGGVNAGWTSHAPLSIINYSAIDLLSFPLHIIGLSSLFGSINFIVTLLKSSNLSVINSFLFLPSYSWPIFFTPVLLIISPPVSAGVITTIIFDRHFNRPSFDPNRGGDLLSPQHSPWFSRHPEAHILILPAFGLISEMISKFSQCIIFGRDPMLIALFPYILFIYFLYYFTSCSN